jgi:tetratricopeptide (TPR) repeat protein
LIRILTVVVVLLCLSGLFWTWASGSTAFPPPPEPASLADQDPAIRDLINGLVEKVNGTPQSSDLRVQLGMALNANGFETSAKTAYQQAIELNPKDSRAHYYLALILAKDAQVEEAIRHMKVVINELGDSYAPARWRIGHWLMDLGRVEEAKGEYQRATLIDPNDPSGWYGLARVAIEERRFDDAVSIARQRIVRHSEDRYAHYLLGTALMRLGKEEEARLALAQGTGGSPEGFDPRVFELYGQRVGLVAAKELSGQLFAQLRRAEIVSLLEPYREQHADDAVIATNLSAGYLEVGRVDDAIELLTESIEHNPNHFALRIVLADAYRHKRDFVNALAQAKKGVELNDKLPHAHTGLGRVLTDMGRFEAAIMAYDAAAKLDPTDVATQVQLAGLHAQLQHWEEAQAALDRADELQPGNQQIQALKMRLEVGKEQAGG